MFHSLLFVIILFIFNNHAPEQVVERSDNHPRGLKNCPGLLRVVLSAPVKNSKQEQNLKRQIALDYTCYSAAALCVQNNSRDCFRVNGVNTKRVNETSLEFSHSDFKKF